MKQKLFLLALALLGLNLSAFAQSSDNFLNGMIERINEYYINFAHDNIYIQTDRVVYLPGDEILIEAFVTDAATMMPSQNSNQFNLMLVDNEGGKVYSSIFNVTNGRASGKFQVPDGIAAGPYKLIGFTMYNSYNTAHKVFNKQIFLSDGSQSFLVDYDLDREQYAAGDVFELTMNYYGAAGRTIKGVSVDYTVEDQNTKISEGDLKSDKEGRVVFESNIPSNVGPNMRVNVLSQKRNEANEMTIFIPVNRAVDRIDFYPEGGALIPGAAGKVAYRAFDDTGKPVDFSGSLYAGNVFVSELSSYASGVGSLELIPESGKQYEIRTNGKNFPLPLTAENGAAIRITGQSEGKLHAGIARTGDNFPESTPVLVALLRKGLLYWSAPGTLEQTVKMDIPVKRVPPGVSTLAVFSEDGKLLSSRTFYMEAESGPKLEIKLDKSAYKSRQRVVVDVSLLGRVPSNADNISLTATVVPEDLILGQDILIDDYLMIETDVLEDGKELVDQFKATGDKEILDAMLMALTWNGYSWEYALGIEESSNASDEMTGGEAFKANAGMSYPEEFKAAPMMDYIMGIQDKRHPGIGEPMYKRQLANGMSVLEVIKTIKPYTMSGGKILFQGVNSFYNQQGALIVIDGQQAGENAAILSSISPTEVESINISTNPGEIQKYTGLNVVGIIEITLKGSSIESRMENATPRDEEIMKAVGHYLPGYPDYSIENDARSVLEDHRTLLYWDPEMELNENQTHQFEFYTSDSKGSFVVTIQGMVGLNPVASQVVYKVE